MATSPDIRDMFYKHGIEVILEKGNILFHQGDPSNAVYYVVDGILNVYATEGNKEPVLLNKVEAGELLGELGAITQQPRSATLIAESRVVLSCISTVHFRELLADNLSMLETMTLANREHLISADMARIHLGNTYQQMQKRVANLGKEKEQLQELLRLREELEAMVVHDLRNPLNNVVMVLSILESMKDQVEDPKTFMLYTRMAKGAAQRMTRLISTLLDIARLEAGKLVLKISEFDLSEMLQEIAEAEQPIAKLRSIEIVTQAPPGLMLRADRDVLWRVVANLLDNALKFAPPSSKIGIAAQSLEKNVARMDVIDDGPGIPPEERERIFEKFTQVKDAEHAKRSGTGLGLTFCRMAVEAHGGTICVEAGSSGSGSRFIIQLPSE